MKEGLIKDAFELILKEIQTIISVSYIITVGIGMLFNFQLYSEFGINIFDYADVFDFLIAPFADFHIILFSAVSIFIVYILFKFDSYWKRKWPKSYSMAYLGKDKKTWFNLYRNVVFAVTLLLYLFIGADYYGSYSKKKIMDQTEITIRMDGNEIKTGKLIGKTNDVLFLLKDEEVYAIPFSSSVKEIKLN